jgi:hypothetical protein
MPNDFSPLGQSLERLAIGLSEVRKNPWSDVARNGMIQQFELSYEIAIKFIRRILVEVYGDAVYHLPNDDLLQKAAEHGVITAAETWIAYRAALGMACQISNASIAAEFVVVANGFLQDGRNLLIRLHGFGNQSRRA